MTDILIIGAGPTGLACAIEAQKAGLRYVVVEQGGIADAIRRFPVNMTFFSTPELLSLDGLPFTTVQTRPSRAEALQYYRGVATYYRLNLRLHTKVFRVTPSPQGFSVETSKGAFAARRVIVATGYFDATNRLDAPGEDLPHVSHYYDEPYRYAFCDVAIVGGRNSAVEAALDLWRHGARVTLIHRKSELGKSVKYWIRPDIENRIKNGEIRALFSSVVERIEPQSVLTRNLETGARAQVAADFVFPLIGYRPDEALLRGAGVEISPQLIPNFHPETFQTNVPGLYVAGSVMCGCETWSIFIENGRAHATPIIRDIVQSL
jgi:thioredoxin reductase (NADPH)